MPSFSEKSLDKLATCHPDLKELLLTVVQSFDCTVVCGHRGEKEQNEAFAAGKSKKRWPNSLHNGTPSNAVDVMPYPIDWNDIKRILYFAGFVMGVAQQKGIRIRYGGDWNCNNVLSDETFRDLVHFELIP